MTTKYYKILTEDGRSNHGGNLKWDLPKNGKPGKWHHVKGWIEICHRGLHLTTNPEEWIFENCSIYEAEPISISDKSDDKIVTKSARLIRKLSSKECVKFGFVKGNHKELSTFNDKFNNDIYVNNANASIIFGENFKFYSSVEIKNSKISIVNLSKSNLNIESRNSVRPSAGCSRPCLSQ